MTNHVPNRRKRHDESGAALIELSLSILLLLIMLLGIMGFGYAFFVQQNMVVAARDAARVMAIEDSTPADAIKIVKDRLDGIPLNFKIQVDNPDSSEVNGNAVTVSITTPLNKVSFGLLSDGNLKASVTMRRESSS